MRIDPTKRYVPSRVAWLTFADGNEYAVPRIGYGPRADAIRKAVKESDDVAFLRSTLGALYDDVDVLMDDVIGPDDVVAIFEAVFADELAARRDQKKTTE